MKQLSRLFLLAVDASSLAAFRVLFGSLMVWEVLRYVYYDRIAYYYIYPKYWFTYPLFDFIKPVPGYGMYLVFLLMGITAVGVALGLYFRLSIVLLFLIYTYVFLIDQAQYNNHYYMISLVAFLLCFTDAHRRFSLDKHRLNIQADWVPLWQPIILRLQVFIVYFGGGIAKLNADWLQGKPLDMWLSDRKDYPLLGAFFETELAAYFFSYGGLIFDLCIGFLLWHRPTRSFAFAGVLFFNLTNKWLFSIGIFPYMMIAATVLFCDYDWPGSWVRKLGLRRARGRVWVPKKNPNSMAILGQILIMLYLGFQVYMPLRHWLFPGNVSWTEEGHNFAWHMKLRDKSGRVNMVAQDVDAHYTWHVDLTDFLTYRQIDKMSDEPMMIHQFAQFLRRFYKETEGQEVAIFVDAWASLNGRPYHRLIAGDIDLGAQQLGVFESAPWIVQLREEID